MNKAKIEARLMAAELELDGLKTHITMRKEACSLYGTDYDKKIRRALTAVRSARDLFRIENGSKQWTLTTRGGSNRHAELPWHLPVRPAWKCPHCKPDKYACPVCFTPLVPFGDPADPLTYDCTRCHNSYCADIFA